MAITLEDVKKGVQDDLQLGVIDEFAKSSFLVNNMIFDDCVSPTGNGGTLTYGYTRLSSQPSASFREINEEFEVSDVKKDRYNVDLKVFGGSFEIDRVLAGLGGVANEVELQIAQKIKAANALFNDTVINGDTSANAKAFDGLEKAITGTSTEFTPGAEIDLSTSNKITENYMEFLDILDEFLMGLDGDASFIGGNVKLIAKIRACARRAGMYKVDTDSFGKQVESYCGIPLVNLGTKAGTNEDVAATDAGGKTSLYAARLGIDAFHAVSVQGKSPVRAILPDFNTAGAVKKGEVEMVAAVALKSTKAAGILRDIKVV